MRFFKHIERIERRVSNKVHPFFLVIILMILSFSVHSQEPSQESLDAYYQVLELNPEPAYGLVKENKSDAFSYYAANLADAIELFITEDPALYEVYEKTVDDRLETLNDMDGSDPFRLFAMGEIRLQTSFLNAKFGEELSSVWNLRKAYFLLNENREKFPDFDYTYKSLGVLHVLLGTVPQKYHWILNLLNMEGTVEQGISELNSLRNKSHVLDMEVRIIQNLLQTYIFDEGQSSINDLVQLNESRPDNLLVNYVLSAVLMKNSEAAKAEKLIDQVDGTKIQEHDFYLYYYLQAETQLLKGDYTHAISGFEHFLENFKGKNFVKDVHYKIFLAYYLMGDEAMSKQYYKWAQTRGSTIIETDRFASRMVSKKEFPNPVIMKIRLATDGGYYGIAKNIINENSTKSFDLLKDQIEFNYRKGRLFHKMGKISEAIPYYLQTIEDNDEDWYFGANSALQLGYIYMDRAEFKKANSYFKMAMEFKHHEYKNSIDNKAIAAMKKIEKEL